MNIIQFEASHLGIVYLISIKSTYMVEVQTFEVIA
jgi:hypothetical protein